MPRFAIGTAESRRIATGQDQLSASEIMAQSQLFQWISAPSSPLHVEPTQI
jgi:hypothetical protein